MLGVLAKRSGGEIRIASCEVDDISPLAVKVRMERRSEREADLVIAYEESPERLEAKAKLLQKELDLVRHQMERAKLTEPPPAP